MKFKLQKAHLDIEIANKNWDGKSSGKVVHNVAHVVTFNWKRKWCSFKNLIPFVILKENVKDDGIKKAFRHAMKRCM